MTNYLNRLTNTKTQKMKSRFLIGFVLALLTSPTFSQKPKWNSETSKNGRVKVLSKISKRQNKTGQEVQLAEFRATIKSEADIQSFVHVVKDVSMHKKYLEYTEISKTVKTYSDSELLVYYYFDPPWPVPDSDCVIKFSLTKNNPGQQVVFEGIASPSTYQKTEVKRMDYYDVKFILKKLNDGKTEVTLDVKMSPATEAPDWLLNTWFPEGPAGILTRLAKLAE